MDHWILVVIPQKTEKFSLTAREILTQRIKDKFFGIPEKSGNRYNIRKNDVVIFYLGRSEKAFAGTATVATNFIKLTRSQLKKYSHKNPIFGSKQGIFLKNGKIWGKAILVKNLLHNLEFIKDKRSWGAYFQGTIIQITKRDFNSITKLPEKKVYLEGNLYGIEDRKALEGYQSDKRYLYTKRNKAIVEERKRIDQYSCQACGFKLRLNDRFIIECHHLIPLARAEERITSVKELVCLCPTCHRIVHMRTPPYSLKEVRNILKKQSRLNK